MSQGPITLLIAALGGEGGGVLAEWLVEAASAAGYPVQSTSIPGVSQRTGATTYYLEIYPVKLADLGGRQPVLALVPCADGVDVVVASELVEAGRALHNGYVTGRTTLIASTHRVYTVQEKMAAADQRYDADKILTAARTLAKRAILADFSAAARESGALINAVLFGALCGAGVLPLSREHCEAAMRKTAKGAEANLRGFAAGLAVAAGKTAPAATAKRRRPPPRVERIRREFPPALQELLELAAARLADYQDEAYAALFLDRVRGVLAVDREAGGEADGFALTRETARLLALWMSYEDVIRVADLKSRPSRLERVRREVGARPGQPVVVVDYLKPGLEEACSLLPPAWARHLRAWAHKRGRAPAFPLKLKSSSIMGYLALRTLAAFKPLRRRSSRYAEEQALMERWLGALKRLGFASLDRDLALEIARCAAVVRGYGETHGKGRQALLQILEGLLENEAAAAKGAEFLKAELRQARSRILGAEKGCTTAAPAAPATVKPLVFMKKPGKG
jgi:indolepyruvate ferredoxin oxidoreductase beta subunit